MNLTQFISKSCIVPELTATNKLDALKELTHLLFEKKRMKGAEPALDQILAREVNESTGIGRHIAIPHARVSGIKTLACAVGRAPDGLDFMALDKTPVHLIFLICYPPAQQTTYLNFVATVTRVLHNPEHYRAMLAAEAANEMYALIEKVSEGFTAAHVEHVRQLRTDPAIRNMPDAHADLILLARLQLYEEMLGTAHTGKKQIQQRIDGIRNLVELRILKHYDRLMKTRSSAVVSVEGDTCQGCFVKLPSKFAQQVRQDTNHIHTCPNCNRYIYIV